MNKKEAKKGQFIEWKADRTFRTWYCYGKIISVKRDNVVIITYDDFKETTISLSGTSIKNEIAPASKADVINWFIKRKQELELHKIKLTQEYENKTQVADDRLEKIDKQLLKFR